MAGVISAKGLFSVVSIPSAFEDGTASVDGTDTYAISAAPKIPNLIASLFFSATGGLKDVKTRWSSDIILQVVS